MDCGASFYWGQNIIKEQFYKEQTWLCTYVPFDELKVSVEFKD